MDSIIEVQRQTHEEIEHFERALYQILAKPAHLHQQKVQTEHKASQILDRISARVNTLSNLYRNDERKQELEAISGSSKPDDLSGFYSGLGKIQEHHAKYPDGITDGFELELLALTEDPAVEEGDEDYAEEDRMCNMILWFCLLASRVVSDWELVFRRGVVRKILGPVRQPHGIQQPPARPQTRRVPTVPRRSDLCSERRGTQRVTQRMQNYQRLREVRRNVISLSCCLYLHVWYSYIKTLHGYLTSFLRRSQPLVDHESQRVEQEADFEKKWEAGEIDGWEDQVAPKAESNGSQDGIWCSACK